MTIGDLWLGNSLSKIKDDVSVLEKVTLTCFQEEMWWVTWNPLPTLKCNGSGYLYKDTILL
jgi:hypothetical protein